MEDSIFDVLDHIVQVQSHSASQHDCRTSEPQFLSTLDESMTWTNPGHHQRSNQGLPFHGAYPDAREYPDIEPNVQLRLADPYSSAVVNSCSDRSNFPLSDNPPLTKFSKPEFHKPSMRTSPNRSSLFDASGSNPSNIQRLPSTTQTQAQQAQYLHGKTTNDLVSGDRKSHDTTPIVRGIRLISPRSLPDRLRTMFPFQYFNAIQSKAFHSVYSTDDNFVLSAPTGSGKTVIFELAIARTIIKYPTADYKIIYMAPLKALCSERKRDWRAKFGPLNLTVDEMTGDSDNACLKAVRNAEIIVTTPEKWDSMTRKWKDHEKLVRMIRLILIDEVHILGKDRGATLEAVVSRMKSVESPIRFIALSATIPNCEDVAAWLGKSYQDQTVPAVKQEFGEDFRPVKLQKHIVAYESPANDFGFDALLGKRVPDVIQKYSVGKPILVFCFTRSSCSTTATILAKWASDFPPDKRPWPFPHQRLKLGDETLAELSRAGVVFHHGGVIADDRQQIEKAFSDGELGVICCTSTLAVGVNLPCHMVIVKGTVALEGNSCVELTDLDILQMLGRAGRPQFDSEAVAVIMTRKPREEFFRNMVSCSQVVESKLHLNLIEHLNAEIGLGSIRNSCDAFKWLSSTFLEVRLRANPGHYKNENDPLGLTPEQSVESICTKALDLLKSYDLVAPGQNLQQTGFGAAMARYYVSFETMKGVIRLPQKPKISEILSTICTAHEFREIKFRPKEKVVFKEIVQSPSLRFPIKDDLLRGPQKVSLLIQSVLGSIDTLACNASYRTQFEIDQCLIFQHARRLIRCIVDCQVFVKDSVGIRNGLMLVRSFGARVWDDSPLCLQQLDTIGPVGVRKLIAADIVSVEDLINAQASHLQMILSRNPPYGMQLLQLAKAFPRLRVSLRTQGAPVVHAAKYVLVNIKAEIAFLNDHLAKQFRGADMFVCFLAETSDGRNVDFAKINAKQIQHGLVKTFSAPLTAYKQSINCFVSFEEIAGTQQHASLTPHVLESLFSGIPQVSSRADQSSAKELEWGDGELADADLVIVEQNPPEREPIRQPRTASKAEERKQAPQTNSEQAERLPNGNWKCKHKCKDRQKCGHKCCTHGMESKPKSRPKQQPISPAGGLASADANTETRSSGMQTTLVFDTDQSSHKSLTVKRAAEQVDLSNLPSWSTTRVAKKQQLERQPESPSEWKRGISEDLRYARVAEGGTPKDGPGTSVTNVDEFEGFDDIDFDLPSIEELTTRSIRSDSQQNKAFMADDTTLFVGNPPNLDDDKESQSEEEMLEAALVGAEDSLLLSSPCHELLLGKFELPLEPPPSAQAETQRTAGDPGQVEAEGTESAKMRELRAFLYEEFGDMVELV